MSLLQLCTGQCRQRVGIVQLFAVVRREQVWVQANHMGGICRAQRGKRLNVIPLVFMASITEIHSSYEQNWCSTQGDI